MATTKKNTNGVNGTTRSNGHVSLAREEYDALVAREESFTEQLTENAKNTMRIRDLAQTCDAQMKRMVLSDIKIQQLEQIVDLQKVLIDKLRADAPAVAELEDLSEFWRQWQIHVANKTNAGKLTHEEITQYEPDLFRSWRNWIRDAGKADRTFGAAGSRMSRADYEAGASKTVGELQEHMIRRLREDNAKYAARVKQLESEIEQKNPQQEKGQ